MPRATKLQKNRDGKLVSAKAKSKDPACSAAASAFAKLRSGGTAPPDLYTTLAKCRAKARNNQSAANQRAAGNEGKAQVLERRADRGLTGAQRIAKAKELIAQRKAGGTAKAGAVAVQAKPVVAGGFDRRKAAQALSREGTGLVDAVAKGRTDKVAGLIDKAAAVIVKREPRFAPARAREIAGARVADIFRNQAARMESNTRTADYSTSAGRRFERKYDRAFAGRQKAGIGDLVIAATGTRTLAADINRGVSTRLPDTEQRKASRATNKAMSPAATVTPSPAAATPKPTKVKGTREQRLEALIDKAYDMRLGAEWRHNRRDKADVAVNAANARMKRFRSAIESPAKPAPMAVQPKPSALEQARSARAAKGDRTTRLKALAEKSMSLAESRATRAGSLSGAAQDRMIDRSMAAAGRYNRLEAARTPYTPPAKAKAPTPSRSTPERQAAVQAAKDRLFGSRLDRAFAKLEGPKGSNFQGLDRVRSAVPYKPDEFVQRLRTQRQQGRYSLDSFEGAAGKITPELKAAQIAEGGTRFAFLSRNNAEPYTPRKASTQAKAAPSLLEQARKAREAKGSRRQRLASLAKKMQSKL